ncbi:linker for activation of T-cells family member 1 isoform X1 [Ursus americanus]|uniref:linker for activation of T-cells family member 1 isoform X1 n=1 Tax=Ursus americanus TaxID=9643 RepID=UPI001E67D819|nr:linker for activation of T-cells family member 1 isoform X1 [Ursus americanus]XP_045641837.1 linker for activation of T-cells family member 1 isoform X1 [Ursus americanus]
MEVVVLIPYVLGLLLLPLLAVALCVRCREMPGSYDTGASDSLTPSIMLKRPPTVVPWPSATSYAPVTSYPPLSQPDLLPILRSPQPHRMPSSRQDSDGANSVASYENEGTSGAPGALVAGRLGPGPGPADRCVATPEPACEDDDEDEEDYHNEGYLEVLPDSTPATSTAVAPAPVPSNPGLRDSAFSMESGEDYVNVAESEESADVSLDGSREYVNVSQELPPMARTEAAILNSQKVEDEDDEEEEGAPDYENLQGLH